MEHLVVKVTNTVIPLLIVIIYRPPQTRFSNFLQEFAHLAEEQLQTHNKVIFCGDFNAQNHQSLTPIINNKLANL